MWRQKIRHLTLWRQYNVIPDPYGKSADVSKFFSPPYHQHTFLLKENLKAFWRHEYIFWVHPKLNTTQGTWYLTFRGYLAYMAYHLASKSTSYWFFEVNLSISGTHTGKPDLAKTIAFVKIKIVWTHSLYKCFSMMLPKVLSDPDMWSFGHK